MIKVITTVGTSIFTNFMREEVQSFLRDESNIDIRTSYKSLLKGNNGREGEDVQKIIETHWLYNIKQEKNEDGDSYITIGSGLNKNCCAEVTSLLKIQQEANEQIDVYLLATDTLLSKLASLVIKNIFDLNDQYKIKIHYNEEIDTIRSLTIKNDEDFRLGQKNLLQRFYTICNGYFDNVILNITGGFKGVIPFLTILGQVNRIPIKYIFEETSVLHTIPSLPIDINEQLFEKHYSTFSELEGSILDKSYYFEFLSDLNGCVDLDGDDFILNPLGEVLWQRYKQQFFFFNTSEIVWNKIKKNEKIFTSLKNNFSKSEIRESKTEMKPSNNKQHRCYDGGRTNPRIFYYKDNGNIYIYEAFESHNQEYEQFLNSLNSISISDVKNQYKEANQHKIELK